MAEREIREKPACAVKSAPLPGEIECRCGAAVEIWSDEDEAVCDACGATVFQDGGSGTPSD